MSLLNNNQGGPSNGGHPFYISVGGGCLAVFNLRHSTEGAGDHTAQAAPTAAHIDEGAILRVKHHKGSALTNFLSQAAAAVAADIVVNNQVERLLSDSGHR